MLETSAKARSPMVPGTTGWLRKHCGTLPSLLPFPAPLAIGTWLQTLKFLLINSLLCGYPARHSDLTDTPWSFPISN